ncbi:formylglycine-generating enzyme family protein [Treponema sp. TIM-1]|uniref:SUMF1/EgtB/PvdO family nonheme iron enzyme n=1 Tax=Treponema sp. TIM-1 TaxID=2898417 RepID=UPI00397FCE1D
MTGFKKITAFSLFFALSAALFAQTNPRLGILPFTGDKDGETIALFFSYAPGLTRSFTVIPRISTIEAITRESPFHQSTGLTDVDTIARLGRPFNVDYVMAGHIQSLGEDNLILITVFQVGRFRLIAGTYGIYHDIEELQEMIPDMVRQLTATSKNNAPYYTPRLSILPVMVPSGIDRDEARLLIQILSMELANSGRYSVQPRDSALQTIMTEQQIKHSVAANPANVKTVGRALNVQQVLSSDIRFLDENKLFIASILNTSDASQQAGGAISYQSVADGIELMRKLASTLGPGSPDAPSEPATEPAEPSVVEGTTPPPAEEDADVPVSTEPRPVGRSSDMMILVKGGGFRMGSRYSRSERPVHEVEISSFYIGKNEVTQAEWVEIMEDNPSYFKGDRFPVENISWYDAVEYCNKRSIKEGLVPAYQGSGDAIVCDFTASGYRLPTEAEWEYAARWGNNTDLSLVYDGNPNVNSTGWFTMNSGESSRTVMTKRPNALGLYDMSGNVYEWCWDWYESYAGGRQQNPLGPASGTFRVIRGGSWLSTENSLRHTSRGCESPSIRNSYIGFRVVRR